MKPVSDPCGEAEVGPLREAGVRHLDLKSLAQ